MSHSEHLILLARKNDFISPSSHSTHVFSPQMAQRENVNTGISWFNWQTLAYVTVFVLTGWIIRDCFTSDQLDKISHHSATTSDTRGSSERQTDYWWHLNRYHPQCFIKDWTPYISVICQLFPPMTFFCHCTQLADAFNYQIAIPK